MLFHIFQNPQYEHMARKERVSKGRTMMPNYFVFIDHRTELSSIECVKRLAAFIRQYKKGILRVEDRLYLLSSQKDAANRARKLKEFFNPSSTVYRLIDDLESLRGSKGQGMK